jgi:hypothetical protein
VTAGLDGRWNVRRIGGLLPPMIGVGKTIEGDHGHTTLGPVRVPFRVEGHTLRYTGPLSAFEDRLEPAGTGFQGRSYLGGMELGRFELRRPSP